MGLPMDEHTALLIFTAVLSLSDSQQQQIGAMFDAAVKVAEPLNTQIENGRQAIFEAVKSGKSADEVKAASDKEGALESQMVALQSQTFVKMFVTLTNDQKPMVDDSVFVNIGEFLSNAREPLTTPPASAPLEPAQMPAGPAPR